MVCPRCIVILTQELHLLGITQAQVSTGQIHFNENPCKEMLKRFEERLLLLGFAIIQSKNELLIEQVKQVLIEEVRAKSKEKVKLSILLTTKFTVDYRPLNKMFVKYTGVNIMRFYILQRIEFIKELISYNELSLEQIALQLAYRDLSYMSKQFKQVVGVAPSVYKKTCLQQRIHLDEV